VENQGDGTVMQQSEVQQVTFSAGVGLGGSATLTYTDLYGQSWTTRPFSLGGGSHYVLDYALGSGHDSGAAYLVLEYGSKVAHDLLAVNTLDGLTAPKIRAKLLSLSEINSATTALRSVRVTERPHKTSHKFSTGIESSTKKTFDIYITPNEATGLNENGGTLALSAHLASSGTTNVNTTEIDEGHAYVNVASGSDASAEIKSALEGLPNNVIPSVTVTKVDVTSANTDEDLGTNGNAYQQTYSVTFSSASNAGDQNMLSCDTSACDHDGCANRKSGAVSISHLHSDWSMTHAGSQKNQRINFQGQGYFIIDLHRASHAVPAANDFSAGNAYLNWNTGSGVEQATFAVIATAATVETALRTITGWEGVTVALSHATQSSNLDKAHAYVVTFPSGFDDGGQTPVVGFVGTKTALGGGAAADGAIIISDQRFSNSLWLGDITGWQLVKCYDSQAAATKAGTTVDPIDTIVDYCDVGATPNDGTGANAKGVAQGEIGDNMEVTKARFGTGYNHGTSSAMATLLATTKFTNHFHSDSGNYGDFGAGHSFFGDNAVADGTGMMYIRIDGTADRPTTTSVDTNEYFAVGSVIDVLDTTFTAAAPQTDVNAQTTPAYTKNVHRSFKVLSHVKNSHGRWFAKLDSIPETDNSQDYALRVSTNNHTIAQHTSIRMNAAAQEVQTIMPLTASLSKIDADDTYRIYINANKPNVEFTEVLSGASDEADIQEAINAFSALSGPVKVTEDGTVKAWQVTFAAIDGDVPLLTIGEEYDDTTSATVYETYTLHEGWSFFAGASARLENVRPGSVINVTSQETVTFTMSGTTWGAGDLHFSYDGAVGATGVAFNAVIATCTDALELIKDDKGNVKLGTLNEVFHATTNPIPTGCSTMSAGEIVVVLPKGFDGSKLELFAPTATTTADFTIAKSVSKNNNGRSFKVVRVEHEVITMGTPVQADSTINKYNYLKSNLPVVRGDELTHKQTTLGTVCNTLTAGDLSDFSRSTFVHTITAAAASTDYEFEPGLTAVADVTQCTNEVTRTTIVVDSMPDAMNVYGDTGSTLLPKSILDFTVYGAEGSCSVSETAKGTYESDVCSGRGNCDGAAGICTCHEGYSGEACGTQTVLV
jgi:hypothetical protein